LNKISERTVSLIDKIAEANNRYIQRVGEVDTAISVSTGLQKTFFEKRKELIEAEMKAHDAMVRGQEGNAKKYNQLAQDKTDSLRKWVEANKEGLDGVETKTSYFTKRMEELGMGEMAFRTAILNEMKEEDAAIRQAIFDEAGRLTEEQILEMIKKKNEEKDALIQIDKEIQDANIASVEETKKTALEKMKDMISALQKAWNDSKDGYNIISLTLRTASSAVAGSGSRSVNDAIITPRGDIITTHPEDYLIATKKPHDLVGGKGITINISGNTLLDERAASKIGDMIVKRLRPSAAF